MPPAGIEPARLTALDFESSASTNSATEAQSQAGILAHRLLSWPVPAKFGERATS